MQSENKYIGDDKFKKFLEHYECPTPFKVVRMKFAGAICSPNTALRPTDVISSFWEEQKQPRLETKAEAELFFKFFMGLWDELFEQIRHNKFKLTKPEKAEKEDVFLWCRTRYAELEEGFLEGFWGGCDDLKLPEYLAQIVDSLSEMADVYASLVRRATASEGKERLIGIVEQTDTMVQKAVDFLIEHAVVPRMSAIERVVN